MRGERQARDWATAYRWLCQRRQQAPANADVWDVRFRWPLQHARWLDTVQAGEYRLSPMQVYRRRNKSGVQWSAHDALVLKWVAMQVEASLPRPEHCHHLKGRGGVSGSTGRVAAAWHDPRWRYVYRTDIRGYYRHILKHQVDSQLQWHVPDPVCRDLCRQWLYYSVEDGGEIVTPEKGICRGSALSPLIGGSLLRHVDSYFATREEIFYARYMDDFIFFTKTRWHLRKAIKRLHEFFDLGGFEAHPDKTQLGRMEHGFDWLGVWYAPEGPRIAPRAIENHRVRVARLYEQARMRKLSTTETEVRVREYEARWITWAERMLALARCSAAG
ncbi:Retron-type reverse transcriptase [Serratia quinivorans]|nr:Retron-type reverse transcriptase [Serratia quinivorans]CAI1123288.1 Retron-type reverse transcriptase [Serratia entomophila]CAI1974040.1 Retron-type reverse transcriptase [Serratia proteamaculans]CAI1032804.1 Retron-type reverse transcriptase [Serratia quinivorans]CAI1034409.1 Retron-type reverse transcriptase [Serratia quinivorans]